MTPVEIQVRIKELFGEQTLRDVFSLSRKKEINFLRNIICNHLYAEGWKVVDIADYINRKHPAVCHYIKIYPHEYKYNEEFRKLADKILKDE